MKRFTILLGAALLLGASSLVAQDGDRRHFLGSSAFVLANPLLADPPDFYQLNFGYRLTVRDVFSVEFITWKYTAPLGIPYGPDFGSADEEYPGYVREFGMGVAYQRFIWRGAYAAAHATPLVKRYVGEDGQRLQSGFQLFLALRAGYHVPLLGNRLFLEPSIAFTHWPISTNAPAAFAERDGRWPNYFLFEPGFHFGVKF